MSSVTLLDFRRFEPTLRGVHCLKSTKGVSFPTAEADGSTSLKSSQGEPVRVYPALPNEPDREIKESGIAHLTGYAGYIILRKPMPLFDRTSSEVAIAQAPADSIFRVSKWVEVTTPAKLKFLKDVGDGCGNQFKANDILFPLIYIGDEGGFDYGYVVGEKTLRRSLCLRGVIESSYEAIGTRKLSMVERVLDIADVHGNERRLRSRSYEDFEELVGDGFLAWKRVRTVKKDKTNVRSGPGVQHPVDMQLMPDVWVETQDSGNEWLLTRIRSGASAGYVRRDRLVFP